MFLRGQIVVPPETEKRAFVTLLLCSEDKRVFRPFLARAHLIYRQHYVHLLQQYARASEGENEFVIIAMIL